MARELSASCWDTAPLLKSRSSRVATDCWYPASASAVASSFSVCVIPKRVAARSASICARFGVRARRGGFRLDHPGRQLQVVQARDHLPGFDRVPRVHSHLKDAPRHARVHVFFVISGHRAGVHHGPRTGPLFDDGQRHRKRRPGSRHPALMSIAGLPEATFV